MMLLQGGMQLGGSTRMPSPGCAAQDVHELRGTVDPLCSPILERGRIPSRLPGAVVEFVSMPVAIIVQPGAHCQDDAERDDWGNRFGS